MDIFKIENLVNYISTDWKQIINDIYLQHRDTKHIQDINKIIMKHSKTIYPPPPIIFNTFNYFNFKDIKVVILGQDPYHQKDQAMGLAFSIFKNMKIPPSLRNIIKEIKSNYPDSKVEDEKGDLSYLAEQGVLLLNSSLTVFDSRPGCHLKSWEDFTNSIIKHVSDNSNNVVFMLWGNYSKSKKEFIDVNKHFILETTHPSPLSASKGFIGCQHFLKCNQYLNSKELDEIEW